MGMFYIPIFSLQIEYNKYTHECFIVNQNKYMNSLPRNHRNGLLIQERKQKLWECTISSIQNRSNVFHG